MLANDLAPPWGATKRILFRFGFAYLALYTLPILLSLPLVFSPWAAHIIQPYADLREAVVSWVGQHLFHATITIAPTGSGDTTYNRVVAQYHRTVSCPGAGAGPYAA